MNQYPRILTIQDISCLGQCSLTVALPILSACGAEACVLPSAVLSTHTGGFTGYTFRDLTEDMPAILRHWQKENISFDAVYTGYLGSARQVAYVLDIFRGVCRPGALRIVDPAMADNGKLYPGFDQAYVEAMRGLCGAADILLPNLTEACLLADLPYTPTPDKAFVRQLIDRLQALGCRKVVLTGVTEGEDRMGVSVFDGEEEWTYLHERLPGGCHGTGDVYASAFTGALMMGRTICNAARIAADYTVDCIRYTQGDSQHWYGVKFEPLLMSLKRRIDEE